MCVFLNNLYCLALLGFLWLTIFTLSYCNNDNRKHILHLVSNIILSLVSKIHCGLCIFTAVYNSVYPVFYGWIVILFPAFCYYEQSIFVSSPCPFQNFDISVFHRVSQCLQEETGIRWAKRTGCKPEWWGLVNWRIQDLAKLGLIVAIGSADLYLQSFWFSQKKLEIWIFFKCKMSYYSHNST